MGDITSSDIVTAWPMTADQIRRLVDDLRRHHNHDGVNKGLGINHGDFVDSPLPDTYHTHANARTHLMGGGTSFADTPGGSAGVHLLSSSYHVAGAGQARRIADIAKGATDRWDKGEYGVQRGRAHYEDFYPTVPYVMFCAVSNEPMFISTHQKLTTSTAWKVLAGIPSSSKRDAQTAIDVLQLALGVLE